MTNKLTRVRSIPIFKDAFHSAGAAMALMCLGSSAHAATYDLPPSADAHVRAGGFAGNNYGGEAKLVVTNSADSNADRWAYLKFDLKNVLGSVVGAKLVLPASVVGAATTVELHAAADDWSETGVTWNNKPAKDGLLAALAIGTAGDKLVDVTDYVKTQRSGDKTVSVVLSVPATDETYLEFFSRESAHSPVLLIDTQSAMAPASSACFPARGTFSGQLAAYARHPSATTKTVDQMLQAMVHPNDQLTAQQSAVRRAVVTMYRDLGIDLSFDTGSFFSNTLNNLRPRTWSAQTPQPLSGSYAAPFSIDAPVYHPIPCNSPRVELPAGYFGSAQLHTVKGFDGVGYGVCIAGASAPVRTVFSDADQKTYQIRVASNWIAACRPENAAADRQVSFIDDVDKSVVDCIGSQDRGGNVGCSFAVRYTLGGAGTLGDRPGTIATGNATLAGMIRAGEATNPNDPIRHAIFFNSNRMWKARVYPAVSGDGFLYGTPGTQYLNGLIPYGAVVQLDPNLDLGTLNLSLPARRILEAMQTYGAYLVNTGAPPMGIYTSTNASEFDPFGGIYRPDTGQGVQDQIGRVISQNKMYVVPPLVKREPAPALPITPPRTKSTQVSPSTPSPR